MTETNRSHLSALARSAEDGMVAYFSMEIAIRPDMPTYSGGLGVLAGDTLRSAADLGLRMVATTLVHRKGYFQQHLDGEGNQTDSSQPWSPEEKLVAEEPIVTVTVEGRSVAIRAWRFDVHGVTGHTVPIYMLDTDLEQNDPEDRNLTDQLYGGDGNYRLRQETVLGLGGPKMLAALGYDPAVYHMNEGHAALLTVAVLEQHLEGRTLATATERDFAAVRERCVFTTHTPVPAGHDRFSMEQAHRILGEECATLLERAGACHDGLLNMTYIALRFSRFVNGVAMQHGKVSRAMFPDYKITAITNGVHAATWTSAAFQAVFDRHMPRWRQDNVTLRYAIDIPENEVAEAHGAGKKLLMDAVRELAGTELRKDVFTIGFARRAATYKRADLFFHDPERLVKMAEQFGGLQILYSGKAHPADQPGKAKIKHVIELAHEYSSDKLKIVYLENYAWKLGALLTGGVDLWLNTPKRPYEASGTSGMKAALNGVPSLSILDGWWIEGWIEGVTGWAIEDREDEAGEAASLYEHLEQTILPLYYQRPEQWQQIMRSAIALNGSFFNTQRMIEQYIVNAYYPESLVDCSAETLEPILSK
ncbi:MULTISPECIES: alpha-glucan family phosphorylase [Acidobacterium]|uniref:glycogen phosphorylase n=1 Tax=Acidobacterium capsulatum (strain ATCC 51196 / DSM 11244 / BCRC 80197 / JCM 7670 / NBRC 15755 / NCIMB 13165 / 161) TaxID=240015 RepID=C1FA95_ACIC5|nr:MULTISPECIES: alpha-glucan family phosphorylase [Acidobacterium]ACO31636.1 alpha-glucan phosphorylase [Acidobacterium capsulatum ATCC 51196]HCT62329.1 alpha-glucan family phosphorylase [Acidobacterium sp.]